MYCCGVAVLEFWPAMEGAREGGHGVVLGDFMISASVLGQVSFMARKRRKRRLWWR